MYGMAECFIAGRVTADIALRKSESGSYCYFSVAINKRPRTDRETGDKVELPPMFLDLQANGPAAEVIAKYVKKGTWFQGWCTPKVGKPREQERDGKTYVYHDTVFRIQPGRFDFMNSDRKDEGGEGGGQNNAPTGADAAAYTPPVGGASGTTPPITPPHEPVEPTKTDGDDFEEVDSDTRRRVDSTLPF